MLVFGLPHKLGACGRLECIGGQSATLGSDICKLRAVPHRAKAGRKLYVSGSGKCCRKKRRSIGEEEVAVLYRVVG